MATTHQGQRRETRDEAICRLALGARERGIHVLRHEPSNEYFVESASEPGKLHRVTAVSCTCKGFQYRGYCCHLAALLDHLGWLPESTPPTPAPIVVEVPCDRCDGIGWGYGGATVWTCVACHGSGVEPTTALAA